MNKIPFRFARVLASTLRSLAAWSLAAWSLATWSLAAWSLAAWSLIGASPSACALDGGTLRLTPRNGWLAFEVISQGDNPASDGFNWAVPGTFDGVGAQLFDDHTLRVQFNHEVSDSTITELNLRMSDFRAAIHNTIAGGNPGGVTFVESARQAYDRWSSDGGATWTATSDASNTSFYRFCSSQSYEAHTFGTDRGFVDPIYITGEEGSTNRLFAIDLQARDFYLLSGVAGGAPGGLPGMPHDSWENAALLDTGETEHVALLLSPDGGSQRMQIYVGEKGKDTQGNASNDFLARNGLAYGSYYYLNGSLPTGVFTGGTFDTTSAGALASNKLEDVDTSAANPNRAVLGDQDSGLFTFDFNLDFSSGVFDAVASGFSVTRIQPHINDVDDAFGDADNVDWTGPTTFGNKAYPEGLIFVNEDTGTNNGEVWMNAPDGSDLQKIADTAGISTSGETSGILDISRLVGYNPGSVLLTTNQGAISSLSVLIHPEAQLDSADFNADGNIDGADLLLWQQNVGQQGPQRTGDADHDGDVDQQDLRLWERHFGTSSPPNQNLATSAIPEPPTSLLGLLATLVPVGWRWRSARSAADEAGRERGYLDAWQLSEVRAFGAYGRGHPVTVPLGCGD
jgi:hypothetical protein